MILRSDVNKSQDLSQWRFETSTGYRIRFIFHDFSLYWSSGYYSALEIGDGISPGISSKLAHFRGLDEPSDVTSISDRAWMTIYDPGLDDFSRLHRLSLKSGLSFFKSIF